MAAETDDDVLLDELWGEGAGERPARRRRRSRRARRAGSDPDQGSAEPDEGRAHPDPATDDDTLFGAPPAAGHAPSQDADDDVLVYDHPDAPDELDELDDGAPRRSRRSRGRRAALRRKRRRRAVLKGLATAVLVAAVAVGAVWGAMNLDLSREPEPEPVAGPDVVDEGVALDPQPTAVLATFDEQDFIGAADQIAVLAWDRETSAATILLVPTGITTDLPGHGVGPLGDAFAIGEGPLLDAAIDNLLALDLDVTVGVSRQAWASLFTRVGGLTIDVPERLRVRNDDGSATVRFAEGEQFLDGPRLAELLTFETPEERELDTLPRVQLVLLSLLDAIAEDPAKLDAIFADGAPMLEVATPDTDIPTLRTLFAELAAAQARGDLVVRTLPVSPLGAGDSDTYRLDEDRAAQLIDDRFAPSKPVLANQTGGRRLEIRNGNGVAGVSSEVAQALIPLGFRVLLTGNADDFDHETTRIVVYDDSDEQLRVAREIRDALGVGRVELSEVPQDVVDITIVVGADYVAANR